MADIDAAIAGKIITLLGYDGAKFYNLLLDAAGHLQIDVVSTALAATAATSANQDTMITALELIDDLRNALETVGTDRFQVRGEDQLFSYKGQLVGEADHTMVGAGNYSLTTGQVPAGEVWVITSAQAYNRGSVNDRIYAYVSKGANSYILKQKALPVIDEGMSWSGHVYLVEDDYLKAFFAACTGGDALNFSWCGYKMTMET